MIPGKKVFIHPKWNRDTFDYDVAVLELIKPIPFDENSGPIELTSILPPPGKSVELIGWGKTEVRVTRSINKLALHFKMWGATVIHVEHKSHIFDLSNEEALVSAAGY